MVVAFDIETLGKNAYRDKIILIGMKRGRKITQWKIWETNDELKMIQESLKAFEQIPSYDETIVGYNNLKFDVPFIIARLSVFGKMTPEIWDMLHNKKWLDLYQFLGNDYRRMTYWLNHFKIKRKHEGLEGKHMPDCFKRGQYDKIEQHNSDDLTTSEKLYLKLRKKFPDLLSRVILT
ncbi:MAG: ribonuclease H-like domain-containing protein [archaeon]|nr:ribonuclease H-like domain-containing protein [archaeon]